MKTYIVKIITQKQISGDFKNYEEVVSFVRKDNLSAKILSISEFEIDPVTKLRTLTDYHKVEGYCDSCDRICFEHNSKFISYDDATVLLCDNCRRDCIVE